MGAYKNLTELKKHGIVILWATKREGDYFLEIESIKPHPLARMGPSLPIAACAATRQ